MKISIVIPIFNEEEVLPELQKRLRIVQNGLGVQNEVIFVDDGSTDNSFALLEEFCRTDSRIKVIQFSRNFGHHIAITAGIDYALGDIVVLMDGDLQNRPEDIHKLLQKMNEGYDIVYTARKDRRDPLFKKIGSFFFLLVLRRIVTDPVAVETSIFGLGLANLGLMLFMTSALRGKASIHFFGKHVLRLMQFFHSRPFRFILRRCLDL